MNDVLAELITIGDEILYGQIVDTNTQWMSEKLDEIGIKTIRKTTVGDNEDQIMQAFREAESRANIVLITGGLGPTNDDITKPCLANFFNSPISLHQQAYSELKELFETRGFQLTETNKRQAELPDKCTMISNRHGSAPGMWFERNNKVFVSMPGVPHEMKAMMKENVLEKLQNFYHTPTIFHKMIQTVGIGESWLSDTIKDWEGNLPSNISLAYLPGLMQVKLRLTAMGSDIIALEEQVNQQVDNLIPLIEKHVFGYDNETLEEAIGKLLIKQEKTLSTAESCTGGHIAHTITSVPGSSAYYNGSLIPYQNDMKMDLLDVKKETLEMHGAVSEATVIEMAQNIRRKFRTDIGVASSGIAGPGGGTKEKPVGLVWIAYSDGNGTITKKLQLGHQRLINIKRTTTAVLYLIWQSLVQNN
ncbi:competence/damage-inducible protein A [Fulvivirgaceae bacterium BMA10]|uniref:CinA-like protein n=1 Tax=Splendidivirga corallicola TaxID=3051826 RepID=A0ABT8KGN0_9BACT|nr:competence/damage-inducible protein A [Fulvivirgaceae bacterium BMA10]